MPSGNIFVVSDITDSKRAEEALKMSERLAATGRLAHSIAHEINNPLEAVVNLLYLMEHSSDWLNSGRTSRQATAEIARVSRITKQTLAFHREATSPIRSERRRTGGQRGVALRPATGVPQHFNPPPI